MAELDKGKLKGFAGKLFAQTEGEKGCLFELDGNKYKLQGGYDEITGGSLFDNEFDLDGVTTNTKIINFNEVKRIEPKSFESLKSESDQLEFYFESDEVIKLDPYAFGSDFSKLRAMKGNNKKVEIMLSSETFENHDVITNMEAIEDVDLYLYGKWTKEELNNIIKIIKNGKIYRESGKEFELSDGKFTSADLTEDQLNKLNDKFIKLIMEKETTDGAVENEQEKKTKVETEISAWDDLNDDTREKMITFVIGKMVEKNFYIRAIVDANKVKIKYHNMILNEGSFTDIKLINNGDIGILDILKMLSSESTNGKKLENNKDNRDAAKVAVKEYIKKNWKDITSKIKVKYEIINSEGKDINFDANMCEKYVVSNITDAKKYLAHILHNLPFGAEELGKMTLGSSQARNLIECLQFMGEKHKNDKDKTLVKLCISCIRDLKRAIKLKS